MMGKNSRRLIKPSMYSSKSRGKVASRYIHELNSLQIEKSSLLCKIHELEEKLLETQLQLESHQ
jgi:hypothetical protein